MGEVIVNIVSTVLPSLFPGPPGIDFGIIILIVLD